MDRPVAKPDLLRLQAFLKREPIATTSMSLPMIDGMLTASVIGPRAVMPSEFIPWIGITWTARLLPNFTMKKGRRTSSGSSWLCRTGLPRG